MTRPNTDALRLVLDLARKGADTPGCNNWRAASMCRQIVEVLDKAAPASPLPGGGWRTDFENAPKDGTDVLVAPHMAVVSWDFGAERWIVGVIPLNDDRTIADDWTVQPVMFFEQYLSNWGVEPTHWMPLPAAPTGDAG